MEKNAELKDNLCGKKTLYFIQIRARFVNSVVKSINGTWLADKKNSIKNYTIVQRNSIAIYSKGFHDSGKKKNRLFLNRFVKHKNNTGQYCAIG